VGTRREHGAATVEHAALGLLIAVLVAAGIAAAASGPLDGGRELGSTLGRKLRCAARGPGPCWRDPLTEAYGRPLAGTVRALAPPPATRTGAGGEALYPVDFRYCRAASCAIPGPRSPALTASNRRTTAFVAVDDRRRTSGIAQIDYWLYRPTLGWERIRREATSADVARLASTPLLETDVPTLVSLETLPGANHFDFAPGEEPPWQWQIERR
jgi:Flp pilus assembly pilin Flp